MQPNPTHPADMDSFRRGLSWIKKTGIGHTGKKAKRLVHRRDRHTVRHQLQTFALI